MKVWSTDPQTVLQHDRDKRHAREADEELRRLYAEWHAVYDSAIGEDRATELNVIAGQIRVAEARVPRIRVDPVACETKSWHNSESYDRKPKARRLVHLLGVNVTEELWVLLHEYADCTGSTVSSVARDALQVYLTGNGNAGR